MPLDATGLTSAMPGVGRLPFVCLRDTSTGNALLAGHLRLAVIDAIKEAKITGTFDALPFVQAQLWREDPDTVAEVFQGVMASYAADAAFGGDDQAGRHGLRAERMRELRRPLLQRKRQGLTLAEIVGRVQETTSLPVSRSAVVALMVHHGYLELVGFGGRQRRHLLTGQAVANQIGHNVHPHSTYSPRVGGVAKAAPFPVIYPEVLEDVTWTFDLERIQARVVEIVTASAADTRKQAVVFLLECHSYLPDQTIADWCGVERMTVSRLRKKVVPLYPP